MRMWEIVSNFLSSVKLLESFLKLKNPKLNLFFENNRVGEVDKVDGLDSTPVFIQETEARPLVKWGLQRLVFLQTFGIGGCKDLLEMLLKEQLLPSTLTLSNLWNKSSEILGVKGTSTPHLSSKAQK